MRLRPTLLTGFPIVQILFLLQPSLPGGQRVPATQILPSGQADKAAGTDNKSSTQSSEVKEVTFPRTFKPVWYTPKQSPPSWGSVFTMKMYESSGELVLEKEALTFKTDKETMHIGYQQIESVTHELLPSRFLDQPPLDWVVVRFRGPDANSQLAMFRDGRLMGYGKDTKLIFGSTQWAVNAIRAEMAAKRSANEVTLPPLERLARWVDRFETAEARRDIIGLAGEEMEKALEQATTEMKAFLDAHPDDVDAIVLSVRLARFQEVRGLLVLTGQNLEEQLVQAEKEGRARVDELAGRLDHALALQPNRADSYYWKARIYGVQQFAIRNGTPVRISIDLQEAIRSSRRATELAPENVSYREALAQYLIVDGKYDDAAEAVRTVAGGQHIIPLLLADRKAVPVPEGALEVAGDTLAEMWKETARFGDYPNLRVLTYVINAPASEVTAFYQKRWPGFKFFEAKEATRKDKDGRMRGWGQVLRGPSSALQPLANKRDFEKASKNDAGEEGLSLMLMEFQEKTPVGSKDHSGVPVGEVYCVLYVLNNPARYTHAN